MKLPAGNRGEVVLPTTEQVATHYETAVPWLRPAVVLGAGLGLRAGETAGLTLDRVLWLERAVRIDRQWLSRHGVNDFRPAELRGVEPDGSGVGLRARRARPRRPTA